MGKVKLYFYYLNADLDATGGDFNLCVDECEAKETKTRYVTVGKMPYDYECYKKQIKKTDIGKLLTGYSHLRTILTERNDIFVRKMFSDYMTKCVEHEKKQLEMYQHRLEAIESMRLEDKR